MWRLLGMSALLLAGCGAETATTAVTAGALKKQEIEEGKKTLEKVQQRVSESTEQVQQSPQRLPD